MQRGNLIIYDNEGKIWLQTGEAEGDILPHEYPVGLPYMELPFGIMATRRVVRVDVTTTPHTPVFEEIEIPKTPEQLQSEIEQLENELLLASGVI